MGDQTLPPFDGETESDTLPDNAALEKTTVTQSNDNAPPMNSPARGPMDQTVPDVATGSTPLTRHDD